MHPIAYIERINAHYTAKGYPPYQWSRHDTAPWCPWPATLRNRRLIMLSTGGLYRPDQEPFQPDKNDYTYRLIPMDQHLPDLRISHDSYDQRSARQDPNCVFPLDRLRELVTDGWLGGLATHHFTVMGRMFSRKRVENDLAPALLAEAQRLGAEVALLVPV